MKEFEIIIYFHDDISCRQVVKAIDNDEAWEKAYKPMIPNNDPLEIIIKRINYE